MTKETKARLIHGALAVVTVALGVIVDQFTASHSVWAPTIVALAVNLRSVITGGPSAPPPAAAILLLLLMGCAATWHPPDPNDPGCAPGSIVCNPVPPAPPTWNRAPDEGIDR